MGKSIESMKAELDIEGIVRLIGHKKYQAEAVEALVEIGTPAARVIVDVLSKAKHMDVFLHAYLAVVSIGEGCIPSLIEVLNKTNTPNRGAIANALGVISHSIDNEITLNQIAAALLLSINDKNNQVVIASVLALGDVGSNINNHQERVKITGQLAKMIPFTTGILKGAILEVIKKVEPNFFELVENQEPGQE